MNKGGTLVEILAMVNLFFKVNTENPKQFSNLNIVGTDAHIIMLKLLINGVQNNNIVHKRIDNLVKCSGGVRSWLIFNLKKSMKLVYVSISLMFRDCGVTAGSKHHTNAVQAASMLLNMMKFVLIQLGSKDMAQC